MPYIPTEWKNREVERPRTYTKVENPDGTITLIPAEGNIIEVGTPIIADNMNHIEQGIVEAHNQIGNAVSKDDFLSHVEESATNAHQISNIEGLATTLENKGKTFTTTLNTIWTGSSAPFTKTQTINGILATDNPIVDVQMSGTFATDEARQEAWGHIYRITTAANSITLYAKEKPTVSLPIQLKVVR